MLAALFGGSGTVLLLSQFRWFRRASLIEPRVQPATKAKILAAVDRSDADCFTAISAAERATLLRLLGACAADLEAR